MYNKLYDCRNTVCGFLYGPDYLPEVVVISIGCLIKKQSAKRRPFKYIVAISPQYDITKILSK